MKCFEKSDINNERKNLKNKTLNSYLQIIYHYLEKNINKFMMKINNLNNFTKRFSKQKQPYQQYQQQQQQQYQQKQQKQKQQEYNHMKLMVLFF